MSKPRLPQQGEGHAVGLFRRPVAADQGDGPDGAEALKAGVIADQALPAPDRAVGPEAGAVPHEADDLVVDVVVGHAGGQMRVVVLDADQGQALPLRPLSGVVGGEIVRVQIAGQSLRGDIEQALEMGDLPGIVIQRLHVLEIADVLAQKRIGPAGEAEARLLLRAAGEDGRQLPPGLDRERRVAARAPREILLPAEHPAERVVAAGLDVAVVQEKAVRDAAQRSDRLGVFRHHRRVGEVRAGHHQHVEALAEEQNVQRRIGQHHAHAAVFADMPKPRRPLFQQHDGPPEARRAPSPPPRPRRSFSRSPRRGT